MKLTSGTLGIKLEAARQICKITVALKYLTSIKIKYIAKSLTSNNTCHPHLQMPFTHTNIT